MKKAIAFLIFSIVATTALFVVCFRAEALWSLISGAFTGAGTIKLIAKFTDWLFDTKSEVGAEE